MMDCCSPVRISLCSHVKHFCSSKRRKTQTFFNHLNVETPTVTVPRVPLDQQGSSFPLCCLRRGLLFTPRRHTRGEPRTETVSTPIEIFDHLPSRAK